MLVGDADDERLGALQHRAGNFECHSPILLIDLVRHPADNLPFVVSLSNHERLCFRSVFDRLRPNGVAHITLGTRH
jgi:hypothetical protein